MSTAKVAREIRRRFYDEIIAFKLDKGIPFEDLIALERRLDYVITAILNGKTPAKSKRFIDAIKSGPGLDLIPPRMRVIKNEMD